MNEAEQNPVCAAEIASWFYWNKNGKNMYVVGNKSIDKYFMVEEPKLDVVMSAVKLMNGDNSIEQINAQIKEQYQVDLEVDSLVTRLMNAGLLKQYRQKQTNELDMFSKSIVAVNFKEINEKTRRLISILWNLLFLLSIGAILAAVATIVLRGGECKTYLSKSLTYKDSYLLGAILAAIASIFNITMHECAHALTSVRCGLQPSGFSMNLYGGFKFLWMIKIKGMYTVKRYQRIMIMGSGIFTNFVLICLSLTLSIWGVFFGVGSEIASKLLINNVFMILACGMPFNLSDGYYVVSQLTKRTNMRKKMFQILNFKKKSFRNTDFGDVLYAFVSLAMILYSFCLMGIWCYHISAELYEKIFIITRNTFAAGGAAAVPILLVVWIDLLFIHRFYKLIKANE